MNLKSLAKNSYVIKYKSQFKKFKLELSCTKQFEVIYKTKLLKQKHLK